MNSEWSSCFPLFCIILQAAPSINTFLIQMPTRPCWPDSSCVSDALWLAVKVWKQHGGPEARLCSVCAVVCCSLVFWGCFEEGGQNNDALTHRSFAQAAWQFPQCIQICVMMPEKRVHGLYNEQTEAPSQLHSRYHRQASEAQRWQAGRMCQCSEFYCSSVSALAPALISSRTGYKGNTEDLCFQTW